MVQACYDRRLYVCSWFAGRADTNNDLNGLSVSHLFQDILQVRCSFSAGQEYKIKNDVTVHKMLHLLGDLIYRTGLCLQNQLTNLQTRPNRCILNGKRQK